MSVYEPIKFANESEAAEWREMFHRGLDIHTAPHAAAKFADDCINAYRERCDPTPRPAPMQDPEGSVTIVHVDTLNQS